MYNVYVYVYAYACVCYFFVKFYILGRNHQQNEGLPKNTPSTCLGRRSILWLAGTSNTAWKMFDEGDMGGPGGTWGDVCWRCLVWPLNVTRLLQKWMAGNRPHGCRIWYDHIHYLFWLKLVHLNSQRTKSGHFFHELPVWQTPNSSVLHCLLRAPTINPTPLPKSRLSSGTQNQILSLTFEATDARLSRILYSSSGF